MADIPLTQVAGDKTYFVSEGIVIDTISSGQTGNLLTVAESGNKVYRIFKLTTTSAAVQPGISLTTNGSIIESESILYTGDADITQSGTFAVSRNAFSATALNTYDVVECSSFSIDKNAGNTAQNIVLAYEIGEYI